MKKFLMLLFGVLTVYTICVLWVTSDIELNADNKVGILLIGFIILVPTLWVAVFNGWIGTKEED